MKREKNVTVETVRGVSILLVILGHVIGIDYMGGMRVSDDSIYRYMYNLFENMMIPPFAVIAGLIYAMNPIQKGTFRSFAMKKGIRLLLPMAAVGTLYFLVQYFIPGTNVKESLGDIWRIYVFPYTYLWYLPALFLVFILMGIADLFDCLNSVKKWGAFLGLSLIAFYCDFLGVIPTSVINLFAFKNALFLLPFFIFGMGLTRFKEVLATTGMVRVYLISTIIGVLLQQLCFFYPQEFMFYEDYKLKIFAGMVTPALLLTTKWKSNFFVYIAGYAYTLYLFHGFGTAGGRIVLKGLGFSSEFLIFMVTSIVAIGAPILVDKVCSCWNLTRVLFLGKGVRKE